MNPQPFIAAPAVIQVHAVAAILAFVLGTVQLVLPKGGRRHRRLGWTWAALLATVALTSVFISGEQMRFGPFSPIHGLTVLALVMLPVGLLHARRGRITSHRWTMISLYLGALVIAGVFTLSPGRILGRVFSG